MPKNTAKRPRPSKSSSRTLLPFYDRLYRHFGPQHWWPADSPWEMMVGAILTQNTNWTNVEKALQALKRARSLSVQKIAMMPRRRLERLIRPSGYFRQKAERLQGFARELQRDPQYFKALTGCHSRGSGNPSDVDPRFRGGDIVMLRERLLATKGIGPETADSILLYAGNYPVFVVDAYTRRIGQRRGLFHTNDYQEVQRYFHERTPEDPALYNEFHAQLVMLAKHFCTSRQPLCVACPVREGCRFGAATKGTS